MVPIAKALKYLPNFVERLPQCVLSQIANNSYSNLCFSLTHKERNIRA
jgi:hypothetical protein